jgi:hypothetical protein
VSEDVRVGDGEVKAIPIASERDVDVAVIATDLDHHAA